MDNKEKKELYESVMDAFDQTLRKVILNEDCEPDFIAGIERLCAGKDITVASEIMTSDFDAVPSGEEAAEDAGEAMLVRHFTVEGKGEIGLYWNDVTGVVEFVTCE